MGSKETDRYKDFLESMTTEEKRVRKAALLSILEHKPATVAVISQKSGLDLRVAEEIIRRLLEFDAVVADENGAIVGSWGLSLVPSGHRFTTDGKELYTWCAQDIVGIPAALDLDADIYSTCHTCRTPINIRFEKGQFVSANHSDIQVWLAEREAGRSSIDSA